MCEECEWDEEDILECLLLKVKSDFSHQKSYRSYKLDNKRLEIFCFSNFPFEFVLHTKSSLFYIFYVHVTQESLREITEETIKEESLNLSKLLQSEPPTIR